MTRTKKFSLGVKIASILTCVALTAVGFAAWLIIRPAVDGVAEGSFTVYSVEENNVSIEVAVKGDSSSTIIWGMLPDEDIDDSITNPWFRAPGVDEQNLSTTFVVTVKSTNANGEEGVHLDELISSIDVAFAFDDATDYSEALSAKYVAAPTLKVSDKVAKTWSSNSASDSVAPTADVTEMSFEVVVTFAWGELWGTDAHPYNYFNTLEYSEDNATAAATYGDIIDDLTDDTFKLTVSTTAAQ